MPPGNRHYICTPSAGLKTLCAAVRPVSNPHWDPEIEREDSFMRELAVFYCPDCGHYAYYQTSRHPVCPKCGRRPHSHVHVKDVLYRIYEYDM